MELPDELTESGGLTQSDDSISSEAGVWPDTDEGAPVDDDSIRPGAYFSGTADGSPPDARWSDPQADIQQELQDLENRTGPFAGAGRFDVDPATQQHPDFDPMGEGGLGRHMSPHNEAQLLADPSEALDGSWQEEQQDGV